MVFFVAMRRYLKKAHQRCLIKDEFIVMPHTKKNISSMELLLGDTHIIPVVTIDSASHALPLAQALARGGFKVIEITMRTEEALGAIKIIKENMTDICVGAGTVLNVADIEKATDSGADFLVSPGSTSALLLAGKQSGLPLLPGASDASGIMLCLEHGFETIKFFPAEAAGGIKAINAFHGPFHQVRFCPTGGVGMDNLAAYLSSPAVICVGGTWIATREDIRNNNWELITQRATQAVSLIQQIQKTTQF